MKQLIVAPAPHAHSGDTVRRNMLLVILALSELESVTNRGDVAVTQDANGVLQYSATQETMWQNPGY